MSTRLVLGGVLGLLVACGLLLIVMSVLRPRPRRVRATASVTHLLRSADLPRASAFGLVATCLVASLAAALAALVVTGVPVAGALAALAAGFAPLILLRRRVAARRRALRAAWPDAVDSLVSAVRAGMSLPDALADLGRSGPLPLRGAFTDFSVEYRATGSLAGALGFLEDRLADPVADRVVAAVRMTTQFGGTEVGTVLRTLAAMLRDEARIRGEIEARQSWTIAAARMAVAAPWLTLALLCTRPEAVRAFASVAGAGVLVAAAAMSVLAYALMMRIGRLPLDERTPA